MKSTVNFESSKMDSKNAERMYEESKDNNDLIIKKIEEIKF